MNKEEQLQQEGTALNPFEDQKKAALQLYEEMCAKCHHWSGFIQKAIEAYQPSVPASNAGDEGRDFEKYPWQKSSPETIASNSTTPAPLDESELQREAGKLYPRDPSQPEPPDEIGVVPMLAEYIKKACRLAWIAGARRHQYDKKQVASRVQCATCHGDGVIFRNDDSSEECAVCRGEGVVDSTKQVAEAAIEWAVNQLIYKDGGPNEFQKAKTAYLSTL